VIQISIYRDLLLLAEDATVPVQYDGHPATVAVLPSDRIFAMLVSWKLFFIKFILRDY